MPDTYQVRVTSPAGRVRSLSVSQSFGQEPSVAIEVYGSSLPSSAVLTLEKNGTVVTSKTFTVEEGEATGGRDIRMGEYRGVRSAERDLGQYASVPPAFIAQPNYDADLGEAYTIFEPGPTVDPEDAIRDALSSEGITLVIIGGPGIWRGEVPGSFSFEDVSTLELLNATLLKTGARWWLEGDTLTIDGSGVSGAFNLPPSELNLITGYSWADEYPDVAEPEPGEPPEREDFLSECPDYEPPEGYEKPERTPETVRQGKFVYVSEIGTPGQPGYVKTTRTNEYNRRLISTLEVQEGFVDTPTGPQFVERLRTLTEFTYHPNCPDAIVEQHETTHTAADMSSLPNTTVENAAEIYAALAAQSPYLQSERTEKLEYHAEGWLKRSIEVIRELSVLSYQTVEGGALQVDIDYNDRTRTLHYEPQSGGRWCCYSLDTQVESAVVYEKSAGTEAEPGTASVGTVQRVRRSTPGVEQTDAAPPQMSCPPPNSPEDEPLEQGEDEPCIEFKEREYQAALAKYNEEEAEKQAEYDSRVANIQNQDKRAHSVSLGIPRPDLSLNDTYGGGLLASIALQYQDDGNTASGTSSLTIWERL